MKYEALMIMIGRTNKMENYENVMLGRTVVYYIHCECICMLLTKHDFQENGKLIGQ